MYSYNRNKRKLNYMILIIMILVISIGYAILNTNLNIVGSSQINAPTWDIHFENVSVKSGSVTASTPTIDTPKTTVNYTVTLTIPGDYYEFTVDAVNTGAIDGMISAVSNKLNNTEITTLPNYLEYNVSYEDGVDIETNQILAANTSETYKVHVGYKKDINISDLPATAQTLNLSFSVTYVQKDTNAVPVPHPQTVYTANIYNENDIENTEVRIGQSIPNAIIQYNTPQQVMTATNNRGYLKHTVQNNIVTESYIEFQITQEMANNNPGITPGTYTLRGINTYDENEPGNCKPEYYNSENGKCISPYYASNGETLFNAFGNNYCSFHVSFYYCSITELNVFDNLNGGVSMADRQSNEIWGCEISNGNSRCHSNE